jgi:hypothetical protein
MNWGLRVLLLYLGFAAMIGTLVAMSMSQRIELVSPTYYEEELRYQQDIDAEKRAAQLAEPLQVAYQDEAVEIRFPKPFHGRALDGEIRFTKPDDSDLDRRMVVQPDTSGLQRISRSELAFGHYAVKVTWTVDGLTYQSIQGIKVP